MLLARNVTKKDIETRVIERLHQGSVAGPDLLVFLGQGGYQVSKESMYRVLRQLLHEEVVQKSDGKYHLNRIWVNRLREFLITHVGEKEALHTQHLLQMQDGDRITYQFKNPNLMGLYWAHSYNVIFEELRLTEPLLIYHPHEWLIHTRTESEEYFLRNFEKRKQLVFFALGGATELDKAFKKEWSSEYLQINTGLDMGLAKNKYLNVLGDFIFEITTTFAFAEQVDEVFQSEENLTGLVRDQLHDITQQHYKTKLVLTRNAKKAALWQKRFLKSFYIPSK